MLPLHMTLQQESFNYTTEIFQTIINGRYYKNSRYRRIYTEEFILLLVLQPQQVILRPLDL